MRSRLRSVAFTLSLAFLLGTVAPATAQTSASDFYMQYRKALASAKKVEDLMPYVSDKTKKQMQATPADERQMMFEMMQMMNDMSDVKVTKEARTANGVTLTVEGTGADKSKATGTVSIITENGGFKIDRESWSSH